MLYLYLIAAYVLSVALCVLFQHLVNRLPPQSDVDVGEVLISLLPVINIIATAMLLLALLFYWIEYGSLPKWIVRLYGGGVNNMSKLDSFFESWCVGCVILIISFAIYAATKYILTAHWCVVAFGDVGVFILYFALTLGLGWLTRYIWNRR